MIKRQNIYYWKVYRSGFDTFSLSSPKGGLWILKMQKFIRLMQSTSLLIAPADWLVYGCRWTARDICKFGATYILWVCRLQPQRISTVLAWKVIQAQVLRLLKQQPDRCHSTVINGTPGTKVAWALQEQADRSNSCWNLEPHIPQRSGCFRKRTHRVYSRRRDQIRTFEGASLTEQQPHRSDSTTNRRPHEALWFEALHEQVDWTCPGDSWEKLHPHAIRCLE